MTTARSSRPDPDRPPLARLIELAVVVPVEVGGRLIEAVPVVADKVPPAAERVRREIVLARFLGKLAVDQGVRELRARLAPGAPTQPEAVAEELDVEEPVPDRADAQPEAGLGSGAAPVEANHPGARPEMVTLALADYDHLSSAQIVAKLPGLEPTELDAIEEYERAGRHRRTVLGKIEQLRAGQEER